MSRFPGSYAGLTTKQAALLSYLREQDAQGLSPSMQEMTDAMGLLSKSNAHRLLNGLEERGYIKRIQGRARSVQVNQRPSCCCRSRGDLSPWMEEMMKPTPEMIDAALMEKSANDACSFLRGAGYNVSVHHLNVRLSQLISQGVRDTLPTGGNSAGRSDIFDAVDGSRRLLQRQLTTKQHQITDPRRFLAAWEEAGLAA